MYIIMLTNYISWCLLQLVLEKINREVSIEMWILVIAALSLILKFKQQTEHNLEVESLGSVLAVDTILITRCLLCGVVAGEVVCTTSWAVNITRKNWHKTWESEKYLFQP